MCSWAKMLFEKFLFLFPFYFPGNSFTVWQSLTCSSAGNVSNLLELAKFFQAN